MGERYEQVGWLHDEGRMFVSGIKALPEGQPQPEGWRPVYVKVPEPERCPTCGSDNPGGEIMPAHIESEDQLLGFLCGEGRCPDPWHSTAAPDVSASTDQ